MATVLHEQGNLLEAIACYQKALRLQPTLEVAAYQCTLAQLARGDFSNGWRDYEVLCRRQYEGELAGVPLWDGEELQGRRIHVNARCRPSDVLQFIRYIPLVQQRGGEVSLDTDPALIPLLQQSGYGDQIAATPHRPIARCRLTCSVCRKFSTRGWIQFRPPTPTCRPIRMPSNNGEKSCQSLPASRLVSSGREISANSFDRFISIPLLKFEPLAGVPGVTLINLQQQSDLDPLNQPDDRLRLVRFENQIGEADALLDMAALVANRSRHHL